MAARVRRLQDFFPLIVADLAHLAFSEAVRVLFLPSRDERHIRTIGTRQWPSHI
jgi:hypothetical protein